MHESKACPLNRHLHPDNQKLGIPLCQQCIGHNPKMDKVRASLAADGPVQNHKWLAKEGRWSCEKTAKELLKDLEP